MTPNDQIPNNNFNQQMPPTNIPMKICINCKAQIGKTLTMCPYCGQKQKKKIGCLAIGGISFAAIFVLVAFVSCVSAVTGGKQASTDEPSATEPIASETAQAAESIAMTDASTTEAETIDPLEVILQKPDFNGFDMETNQAVNVGGLVLSLPNQYQKNETKNTKYAIGEDNTAVAVIFCDAEALKQDYTDEQILEVFNEQKEKAVENKIQEFYKSTDYVIISNEACEIAGVPAQRGIASNNNTILDYSFLCYNRQWVALLFAHSTSAQYDYYNDYQKILDSITLSDTPAETADGREAVNNGDYSLVTPEFKEYLDSYEAFMDEYVAFMQKYNSSTDTMSMMTDYLNLMQKELEWANKIDDIDETTLSPADDAYYLLVTARVTQKLLTVAYGMSN